MSEALVRSVKKALDALDYVMLSSRSGAGATLSGIAENLDEKPTTVRNILKTMEGCGYLGRNGKLYVPGVKTGDLARTDSREALIKAATPLLDLAAQQTGESFVLTTIYNGTREVISRHSGSNAVGVNLGVAEHQSVYSLVTSRIILAFANDMERSQFYKTNGLPGDEWSEAVDGKLEQCLQMLKVAGFSAERNKSLWAYAFPLMRGNGDILGAVGVYVPAFRMDKKVEVKLLSTLSEIADNINKQF